MHNGDSRRRGFAGLPSRGMNRIGCAEYQRLLKEYDHALELDGRATKPVGPPALVEGAYRALNDHLQSCRRCVGVLKQDLPTAS